MKGVLIMPTVDFKTRTEIVSYQSPEKKGEWVIGIDLGYSSVKGMCSNKYFCIPSYIQKVPDGAARIDTPSDTDIVYKDEEGGIWYIGNLAYDLAEACNLTDNYEELFGQDRYYTNSYIILSEVGTAIGLMGNQYGSRGDKKIVIQAGLPPLYLENGKESVKNVFGGHHKFSLKIGKMDWKDFEYDIDPDDVYLMSQPLGALMSATLDKNGRSIPNAKEYIKSDIMVFDPGFGTLDLFNVRKGNVVGSNTDPDGGMRKIFDKTCNDLFDVYGRKFTISQLQNYLEDGYIKIANKSNARKRSLESNSYSFEKVLEANSKSVFDRVIDNLIQTYNIAENYNYILLTGGTSEAWRPYIFEAFARANTIKIISANANDPKLSNIYSNVRGYFLYRLGASR